MEKNFFEKKTEKKKKILNPNLGGGSLLPLLVFP